MGTEKYKIGMKIRFSHSGATREGHVIEVSTKHVKVFFRFGRREGIFRKPSMGQETWLNPWQISGIL